MESLGIYNCSKKWEYMQPNEGGELRGFWVCWVQCLEVKVCARECVRVHVCVCTYMHVHAATHRGQKRAGDGVEGNCELLDVGVRN